MEGSLSRELRLSYEIPLNTREAFLSVSAWLWLRCRCPEHLRFWLDLRALRACDFAQVISAFPNRTWKHGNTIAFQIMQFHREEIAQFPNYITEQTGFFWQRIHDKRSWVKIMLTGSKEFGRFRLWKGNITAEWLWKFVTKSANYRVKGQGGFPDLRECSAVGKHPGFQSLCACWFFSYKKMKLGECTAATAVYAATQGQQTGLTDPSAW